MVAIRPIQKEDFQECSEKLLNGFGNRDARATIILEEELYNQIFQNPYSVDHGTRIIAWEAAEPLGQLGLTPCPAYSKGIQVASCWWQDFYVSKSKDGSPRGDVSFSLFAYASSKKTGHALLGTPGVNSKVFQLYKKAGFYYWGSVPFYFKILNGKKFLQNIYFEKSNSWYVKVARFLGRLPLLPNLLQIIQHRSDICRKEVRVEMWNKFPEEAQILWEIVKTECPLIFERSIRYLEWRFNSKKYVRLGVYTSNQLVGWVIYKITQMRGNKYFGNMRVGSIVDALCRQNSTDVHILFQAAVQALREEGSDILVANFSHQAAGKALKSIGFLAGPSEYHFFSKNIPIQKSEEIWITRGDSDGDGAL